MRRIFSWIFWLVLAGIATLVCLWLVSRMRGLTSEQEQAVALMQQRAPLPPGGNVFPALWLLAYDVPESQLQAVAEADIAQSTASTAQSDGDTATASVRTAIERFDDQSPSQADSQLFCNVGGDDCLDRVRAEPASYDRLIERNQALLDRVVALQGYGYYRSPDYDRFDLLLPPTQYAAYDLTRLAWQFSRGEVNPALSGACDGARVWRQIGAHSDSLLVRGVSTGYVEGYMNLLARLLGELPLSQEIPASCAVAFAPPAVADASICEAMRGEFSIAKHYIRQLAREGGADSPTIKSASPNGLLWDTEKTVAILAAGNAWACSNETITAIQSDIRVDPSRARLGPWRLECVANFAGCVHTHMAFPAYDSYQWSAQDHAARLELMAVLLHLREDANPDEPLQAQLLRYWEKKSRGERQIRFDDDGRSVELEQYADAPDSWWSLPFFPKREVSEPAPPAT